MLQQDKDYFMKKALEEARKAYDLGEIPVGAVCVYNKEIIATGYNRVIMDNDPTAHAEIVAVREACKKNGNYRLKDVEIYVTVEPCPMCISALINARVSSLIFGAYSDKWGYMTRFSMDDSLWNHRVKVYGGMLSKDSEILLKNFFKKKRY